MQTKFVCLLYELVSLDPMIPDPRSGMYGHLGNYAYFRHFPDLISIDQVQYRSRIIAQSRRAHFENGMRAHQTTPLIFSVQSSNRARADCTMIRKWYCTRLGLDHLPK